MPTIQWCCEPRLDCFCACLHSSFVCAVRIKTCGAATNCFTGNDEFSHSTLIMVSLWYTFGITVLSMRSLFSRPFFGKMLMVGNRAAVCEAALARTLRQATLGGHGGIGNGHPARWTWWEFETSNNTGFLLKKTPPNPVVLKIMFILLMISIFVMCKGPWPCWMKVIWAFWTDSPRYQFASRMTKTTPFLITIPISIYFSSVTLGFNSRELEQKKTRVRCEIRGFSALVACTLQGMIPTGMAPWLKRRWRLSSFASEWREAAGGLCHQYSWARHNSWMFFFDGKSEKQWWI